ncbi:LysR family transcriptional regulator [Telmatospirillum siberiense]|uniref:LysR family transcriptional regulator n=1 Tax=Telmatospirillum siberiense TaxID=382514 RepID=A0A2N3PQ16_9PROT|nr:LysR family transcriptional regulator [Telmatospirillum siberiense]PKU22487.1 LysR family transcriptional regulator [Telmatospirillum siberiense]
MDLLTSMRVFCQVVDAGTFAAAAERENISAAMASRHLMQLESHLRVRLLNRTTRQISLTEAGRLYYERCTGIMREVRNASNELAMLSETPRGTLRFTAPAWFAGPCFSGTIVNFRRIFPDVQVDINFTDRTINIVEEGFDLALQVTLDPPASLIARRIGTIDHILVASPSYLRQSGEPTTPDELADHKFIYWPFLSAALRDQILFSREDVPSAARVNAAIRVNTPIVAMASAIAGEGITIVPAFTVIEELKSGSLRPILNDYQLQQPSLFALYASRQNLQPKVRVFIDYYIDRLLSATATHSDEVQH